MRVDAMTDRQIRRRLRWISAALAATNLVLAVIMARVEGWSAAVLPLIVAAAAIAIIVLTAGRKVLAGVAITALIVAGGLTVGARTEPPVEVASAHNVMAQCPWPSLGYSVCLSWHNKLVAIWFVRYAAYYQCLVAMNIQGGPTSCAWAWPGPMP